MKNLIRGHLVLLLAAALSVACGPTKELTAYQQTDKSQESVLQVLDAKANQSALDSLLFRYQNLQEEMTVLKATFAESIPAASAQVTIPTQSLLDLPEGAKYGTSNGRASVEAERQGNTIVVTGKCDSVARRCAVLEQTAFRQCNTIDSLRAVINTLNSELSQIALESESKTASTTLVTEKRKPPRSGGKWFAAGTILGIAGGLGGQALWKKYHVGALIKGIFTKIKLF